MRLEQPPSYTFSIMNGTISTAANANQYQIPNGTSGNSVDMWRYYVPRACRAVKFKVQIGAALNTKNAVTRFLIEVNGSEVAASVLSYNAAETGIKEVELDVTLQEGDYVNLKRDTSLSSAGSITYFMQLDFEA